MKILVLSSNLIGDTILSSGVISHFYKQNNKYKFTFVIGPTSSQIYSNFPNTENIFVIKKQKYNLHWLKIYSKCIFYKWDIVIDFRSSLISYFLFHKKKYIFTKNKKMHHLDQLNKVFGLE